MLYGRQSTKCVTEIQIKHDAKMSDYLGQTPSAFLYSMGKAIL